MQFFKRGGDVPSRMGLSSSWRRRNVVMVVAQVGGRSWRFVTGWLNHLLLPTLGRVRGWCPSCRRYWSGAFLTCRSSQIGEVLAPSVLPRYSIGITSVRRFRWTVISSWLLVGGRAEKCSISSNKSFLEPGRFEYYVGFDSTKQTSFCLIFWIFLKSVLDESRIHNPQIHLELKQEFRYMHVISIRFFRLVSLPASFFCKMFSLAISIR